jgi:hypothetical protein
LARSARQSEKTARSARLSETRARFARLSETRAHFAQLSETRARFARLDEPRLLLLIFLLALFVRLAYAWQIRDLPTLHELVADAARHDRAARAILDQGWRPQPGHSPAQLYPYLLAAIYALSGRSLAAVRLVQALAGAAAALLTAVAAARLVPAGGRRQTFAAGIAGLLAALYAPAVFYTPLLAEAVPVLLLEAAAVALLLPASGPVAPARAGCAGLALGAAAMLQENLILLAAAAVLFVLADHALGPLGADTPEPRGGTPEPIDDHGLGALGARAPGPLGARAPGPLAIPAPGPLGNQASGPLGNQAPREAGGQGSEPRRTRLPGHPPAPAGAAVDARRSWFRALPAALTLAAAALLPAASLQLSRQCEGSARTAASPRTEARSQPVSAPGSGASRSTSRSTSRSKGELSLFAPHLASAQGGDGFVLARTRSAGLFHETRLFWNSYEIPDSEGFRVMRRESTVLRFDPIVFGLVAPLAAVGLAAAWRRGGRARRGGLLLGLLAGGVWFAVGCGGMGGMGGVSGRSRLAIVPFLLPLAGAAVPELAAIAARRRRLARRNVFDLALLAAAGLAVNLPCHTAVEKRRQDAPVRFNLGQAGLRTAEARHAEFLRARKGSGGTDTAEARESLARAVALASRAAGDFAEAAAVKPAMPGARLQLATALEHRASYQSRAGRPAAALADYDEARGALATASSGAGPELRAEAHRELELVDAGTAAALDDLGVRLIESRQLERAHQALDRAVTLAPRDPASRGHLALCDFQRGLAARRRGSETAAERLFLASREAYAQALQLSAAARRGDQEALYRQGLALAEAELARRPASGVH